MLQLLKNEVIKIYKRPSTLVLLFVLFICIGAIGAFNKYQQTGYSVPDNEEWKRGLTLENKRYEEQLQNESLPEETAHYYIREIAINEYRLEHDYSTNVDYNVWNFVSDSSNLISFIGMLLIIIASGIVANEFQWGTIKLLLIRPISRSKILLSKYITVLLYGMIMLVLLFSFSYLIGSIWFGLPDEYYPYLSYVQNEVKEQSMATHLWIDYSLKFVSILMLTTFAFAISTVFRNSAISIGISLFLLFIGEPITMLLASWFEWAKFLLFANTDLTRYYESTPLISGMSLSFSIMILIIYFIIFQVIAFTVFKKRDIAN